MIISELKVGDSFRIRKGGVIWIVQQIQGMNNCMYYCRSELRSNTRCQRQSFKHKYLKSTDEIFEKVK